MSKWKRQGTGKLISKQRKERAEKVKKELLKNGIVPPPNMDSVTQHGGVNILDKLRPKDESKMRGFGKGYLQEGVSPTEHNKATIVEMITYMTWPVVELDDVQGLTKRVEEYMTYCVEHDRPITNRGLYLATGIGREMWDKWANNPDKYPNHVQLALKTLGVCSFWRENMASVGKLNPLLTIWWQKNYDRMTDQQQVTLKIDNPLGNVDNIKALQEKYAKSAGVVDSVSELSYEAEYEEAKKDL